MKRGTFLWLLLVVPLVLAAIDGAEHLLNARAAKSLLDLTPAEQSHAENLEAAMEQHYSSAVSAVVSVVALLALAALLFSARRRPQP